MSGCVNRVLRFRVIRILRGAYPQVDPIDEMTDLLGAVRAYELNASAVQATKNMITQSLSLLQ